MITTYIPGGEGEVTKMNGYMKGHPENGLIQT